jgi:hypothetical protein
MRFTFDEGAACPRSRFTTPRRWASRSGNTRRSHASRPPNSCSSPARWRRRRAAPAWAKDDFDAQCQQVFANIEAALKSQGAGFANVVEFTTYLVHSQDIAKFMAFRLREFPRIFPSGVYPPNTLLIVDRLV